MAACLAHTILLKVTLIVCAETEEYQNDKLLLVSKDQCEGEVGKRLHYR